MAETQVRIKCRSCGHYSPTGPANCESCGYDLRSGDRYVVKMAIPLRKCPFCAELIQPEAIVCKHCKRDVPADQQQALPRWVETSMAAEQRAASASLAGDHRPAAWRPGVAGVLSFLIPGLGQLYKGQVGRGLLIFVGAVVGYSLLVLPGMIVHVWAIVDGVNHQPT